MKTKFLNFILHFTLIICFFTNAVTGQIIPAIHLENKTFTHDETMKWYEKLTRVYTNCILKEYGPTDSGRPLHVFKISNETNDNQKLKILIMNAIHPGEPDGVNASLLLAERVLSSKKLSSLLDKLSIYIIPAYNIDGMLNRGCCSRANQNGPAEYGFRGNAKNLDLNRDFVKCDTKNAKSFVALFHEILPDVFVDTHVSNGADYQYTLTLIASQYDKMIPPARNYFKTEMVRDLFQLMKMKNMEMAPYVNTFNHLPDSGIAAFYESPRYSSGYTTLFGTLSFVTETHMLKPFDQRVIETLEFLSVLTDYCANNRENIKKTINETRQNIQNLNTFPTNHTLNKSKFDWIDFKGYEAGYKKSYVTESNRLYFDHNQPFTKKIKYYQHYTTTDSASKPLFYVVPQAWDKVVELLKINQVKMFQLDRDSTTITFVQRFSNVKSPSGPYEGHFFHSSFDVTEKREEIILFKGDYIIPTGTVHDYFLASVLEPKAVDSYFRWGFFDSILQVKEGYSDYVFYDTAEELLKQNSALKLKFEEKKRDDLKFKENPEAQLRFIYENSPFYENSANRYPIYKIYK